MSNVSWTHCLDSYSCRTAAGAVSLPEMLRLSYSAYWPLCVCVCVQRNSCITQNKPVYFPKLLWNKWEYWQKNNSTLRPGEMLWKQPNDQSRVFLQVKRAFPTSLIICCSCQICLIWSLFPGRSTFETHARPSYLFTCTQVFLGLLHWWNKYSVVQQYCTYALRHFWEPGDPYSGPSSTTALMSMSWATWLLFFFRLPLCL